MKPAVLRHKSAFGATGQWETYSATVQLMAACRTNAEALWVCDTMFEERATIILSCSSSQACMFFSFL